MDYENDYMDSRYIQSRQNKLILEYDEEYSNYPYKSQRGFRVDQTRGLIALVWLMSQFMNLVKHILQYKK